MKNAIFALLITIAIFSSYGASVEWRNKSDAVELTDSNQSVSHYLTNRDEPIRGGWGGVDVLLAGMKDSVVIDTGSEQLSLATWVASTGYAIEDLAGRIRVGDEACEVRYEDPDEGIPLGFHGDMFDFSVDGLGDDVGEAWQVKTITSNSSIPIAYDLGFYIWTGDDWDTIWLASTRGFTAGDLIGKYSYPAGDLGPPKYGSWCPDVFYTSVPEPAFDSFAVLFFGIILLKRRKEVQDV